MAIKVPRGKTAKFPLPAKFHHKRMTLQTKLSSLPWQFTIFHAAFSIQYVRGLYVPTSRFDSHFPAQFSPQSQFVALKPKIQIVAPESLTKN